MLMHLNVDDDDEKVDYRSRKGFTFILKEFGKMCFYIENKGIF